ncbi:hypothetical protein [Streptomonospora sp. PA3]|uniref:hypothetical protein n=1 Tax=Streptomonospora sp. PA3 TaxID=2607326 RepID=UPI0012DD8E31|nr:hypothetical protein [Streptomonospora sp. PA3]
MTNKHTCPRCGHLVVKDLNVVPQRMWNHDVQTWHCENCTLSVRREFTDGRWSAWQPIQ